MATATATEKPRTKDELLQAQKILQRAHDYIEANGFEIMQYASAKALEHYAAKGDFKDALSGELSCGACCYIGTVRLAAGVHPDPTAEPANAEAFLRREEQQGEPAAVTTMGDGPGLEVALQILDERARSFMQRRHMEIDPAVNEPGRLAERFGFKTQGQSDRRLALSLVRAALRQVHKRLEAE